MRKAIIYAIVLASLIFLLKVIEYKFLVRDLALEFYIGLIAIPFTALGIWSGVKLTKRRSQPLDQNIDNLSISEENLEKSGISKREQEVLQLMANGLSNQEIADRLYVSLNTVKTHSSNLFVKLDVKRRTQAIQRGKELRIIA